MPAGLDPVAAVFNLDFLRLKMRCSIFGTGKWNTGNTRNTEHGTRGTL
jgi:hypothetical protein